MTNNIYVEKLYKRENELIRICNYHNMFGSNCDDIIQDLYVKLLLLKDIDRYVKDNEPNMYIIFIIIKNLIYDFRKKESKFDSNDIEFGDLEIVDNKFEDEKYDFILNEVYKINYWFNRTIIELYIKGYHSIRSLSKETHIGTNTIQSVFHNFKIQCQNSFEKKSKSLKNSF